jgi:CRP-like cAMP-binding protein
MATDGDASRSNQLLALLAPDVRARLAQSMERVSLALKEVVYEAGAPITCVYFPLGGVISLVVTMADGGTVEVATIGKEGMTGIPVFLGSNHSAMKAFSQVPGEAFRLPVDAFKRELAESDGAFRTVAGRYAQAMMNQIAQGVACNHLHSIEERTARWLLMTHDRVGKDEFPLTQEFLSQMLAVRRPSVTIAAGLLEKAALITYKRGRITILDRAGLERAACECYAVVRKEYERLLTAA